MAASVPRRPRSSAGRAEQRGAGHREARQGRLTLDRIDLRILAALQRDGRISKTALADAVGLSVSACLERLRRLERGKLIAGYHALVDIKALAGLQSFYTEVTLRTHTAQDFSRFEQFVQKVDEIIECHALGGGIDYLLKVVCPDVEYYQTVIDRLLNAQIGVDRYFTYIVTKPVKSLLQLPVSTLMKLGGEATAPAVPTAPQRQRGA
jgi:Lrp/AsnC family transcriptional regulator of ectoine degradation